MDRQQVILYVEDDPLSRIVMHSMLVLTLGYQNLIQFEDSTDFMQRLEALSEKPALILLDIHMQPLDGFQMLDLLRGHPAYHDSKVVALTASVMSEEVDRLRNAGFNGVIAKPLKVESFPERLELLLAGKPVWEIVD